jgi:hypothetical protein
MIPHQPLHEWREMQDQRVRRSQIATTHSREAILHSEGLGHQERKGLWKSVATRPLKRTTIPIGNKENGAPVSWDAVKC